MPGPAPPWVRPFHVLSASVSVQLYSCIKYSQYLPHIRRQDRSFRTDPSSLNPPYKNSPPQWELERSTGGIVFAHFPARSITRSLRSGDSGKRAQVAFPRPVRGERVIRSYLRHLCVHRDPVWPGDISPAFSAFRGTLTSFRATFSGTF